MSKRARYDGPHEEVAVFDPEGTVYDPPVAIVKKGAWLPEDVRAPIRDELIAGGFWTEVQQSAPASTKKGDDAQPAPASTKKGDE